MDCFFKKIISREILDSRGNPTVETDVFLNDGSFGRASVPSGASKGKLEATELRDNDKSRFNGNGVLNAVENINKIISNKLVGSSISPLDQKNLDRILCELDGTKQKEALGANTILSVSLATAKAVSSKYKIPLYEYIKKISEMKLDEYSPPTPMMNILNGGLHADNNLSIQEFMIVPNIGKTFHEKIANCHKIIQELKINLKKSGLSISVGDEGGFAPKLKDTNEALDILCDAIKKSNFIPGQDFSLALDCASSGWYDSTNKKYTIDNQSLNYTELIDKFYTNLVDKYPIISIEDGCDEEDWEGFKYFTQKITDLKGVQSVGDDLFVTQKDRLAIGIKTKACNAILIKLNQVGTLSETLDTIKLAKENKYNTIISHRSGETEDTTIAHLIIGTGSTFFKAGSLNRGERICKYNELLRIENSIYN